MMRAGHVARVRGERKVYKDLVGRPEGKKPLGRPRRRWEDGIRTGSREMVAVAWSGVDSVGSGQGSVAGSCVLGSVTMWLSKSVSLYSRQIAVVVPTGINYIKIFVSKHYRL
jgi:hypothetical protein